MENKLTEILNESENILVSLKLICENLDFILVSFGVTKI